ncbi:hypothetical protein [Aureimonas sp. AU40]|uniref:hypothetical protein n=1 Tax=Aureimonas sp. AU40 TaxID=1637747 RepID=UPI00078114D1|nr:hypothetical protein [Aureimonas sp. AU40]
MNVTRQQHTMISSRIESALADLGKELGFQFTAAGGQYGLEAFIKIAARPIDANGKVADPEADNFALFCGTYGLKPTDRGRTFASNGIRYEVVGIAPSRPKFPISCKRVHDGKGFKFPAANVLNGLALEPPVVARAA